MTGNPLVHLRNMNGDTVAPAAVMKSLGHMFFTNKRIYVVNKGIPKLPWCLVPYLNVPLIIQAFGGTSMIMSSEFCLSFRHLWDLGAFFLKRDSRWSSRRSNRHRSRSNRQKRRGIFRQRWRSTTSYRHWRMITTKGRSKPWESMGITNIGVEKRRIDWKASEARKKEKKISKWILS